MMLRVKRHYSAFWWSYPLYHRLLKPLGLQWLWHRAWMRWVARYERREGERRVRL